MRARAVIGAGYGDEGKGRTVDWLAAPHGPAALVVRSNGGAQAGHSVVRSDGLRHVFHHLGAGALRGARTHLSRFMVSHPIVFADEVARLRRLGVTPPVTADPRGAVTTPWDMMANQALELARGGARHGSCGLGFGETVGRAEAGTCPLAIADLDGPDLRRKLLAVRDEWLPARLAELGLEAGRGPLECARSDVLLARFQEQCAAFARTVACRCDADLGGEAALVFEAAQGLALDRDAAGFPFLTRSNTGMANIAAIAAEAGIAAVDPVYVTRCYLTRHGRGPMEDERAIGRWFKVDDPTNRPNPWQESLRLGLLDLRRLATRIGGDRAGHGLAGSPSLMVTCLDQARGQVAWIEAGKVVEGTRERFMEALANATGLTVEAAFSSPANTIETNNLQRVSSSGR